MPTHKPNLSRLSISSLAELTGFAKETISKRLRESGLEPVAQDGRTLYYASREALRTLFEAPDPMAQRARLDAATANLRELEYRKKNGELVEAAEQDRALIALSTIVSSRLQGVGSALAPELAAEATPVGCQERVDRAIADALYDLAESAKQLQ